MKNKILILGANPETAPLVKKAKEKLNWQPKHTLDSLVSDMVAADLERY